MIIGNLSGGLGNQMFQYAACKALSIKKNLPLYFDISDLVRRGDHDGFILNKVFKINIDLINTELKKTILGVYDNKITKYLARNFSIFNLSKSYILEKTFHYEDISILFKNNAYVEGYWQSPLYFQEYSNMIFNDFRFSDEIKAFNKSTAYKIIESNSVSIHLRFGDYMNNSNSNIYYRLTNEYFLKCIKYFILNTSSPTFFIFSDNINLAKTIIGCSENYYYVENNILPSAGSDMYLMSLCKNNIISNSTFSWWAAWLNSNVNKVVICPDNWFNKDFASKNNINIKDLYPKEWIKI